MQKVLVLGTFDSVHDGHRAMLREAKSLRHPEAEGSPVGQTSSSCYLVIAVAPDAVVQELKGHQPHHVSAQRIVMLRQEKIADEVVLGDSETSSWKILKKYKPQIIALGYDQHELRENLEQHLEKAYPEVETEQGWQTNPKKPKIVTLSSHEPDKYHNRIIHK